MAHCPRQPREEPWPQDAGHESLSCSSGDDNGNDDRAVSQGPGSGLTQTVGAAVLKFTTAKWFVFSTSTSWEQERREP